MTKIINTTYSPKTIAAIQFMEPEKASLLKEYFGGILPKSTSVPTVNLTLGIISPEIRHLKKDKNVGEYLAIRKSCETGYPIHTHCDSSYKELDGCIFVYVADLPMAVLRDIMRKHPFIGTYDATKLALEEQEENKQLRENNAKLKKILEILESR